MGIYVILGCYWYARNTYTVIFYVNNWTQSSRAKLASVRGRMFVLCCSVACPYYGLPMYFVITYRSHCNSFFVLMGDEWGMNFGFSSTWVKSPKKWSYCTYLLAMTENSKSGVVLFYAHRTGILCPNQLFVNLICFTRISYRIPEIGFYWYEMAQFHEHFEIIVADTWKAYFLITLSKAKIL